MTLPLPSTRAHSWDFRNFRSPGISLIVLLRAAVRRGESGRSVAKGAARIKRGRTLVVRCRAAPCRRARTGTSPRAPALRGRGCRRAPCAGRRRPARARTRSPCPASARTCRTGSRRRRSAVSTFWPWRSTPFSSITRPIIWRGTPAAFCASSAARPMKSRPSSSATVQARPASYGDDGLVHVLAVEVHAGFQAQRVARAQAGRLHAGGRAARSRTRPPALPAP